jgi:ribonuclease HI
VLDVDMGEALGMFSALQRACDLQMVNMDFETDSKTIVDNMYGNTQDVYDYSAIINDCRRLLVSDLVNSDVKFIKRQDNKVTHNLARETL